MGPEPHRCDVVVVGARAAGAATALLLARAGVRVVVVDRGRYGADTLSTHALMRGAVVQLHRWGLLDRVAAAGTPAIRRTTFRYGTDEIVVPIKASHGVDALYAPRRTVLDALLVDAATAAGAEIHYGVTVTGVRRDRQQRVTGLVGRDGSGRHVSIDAGLVVGADGMRSAVAHHVAAPVERRGTGASGVVYGYWSGLDTSGYEWIFRPNACAGLIPTNGGLTCVFVAASSDRVGRGGARVLESVLERACPDTAARVRAGTPPAGVRTFAGHPGFMRRAWGAGWALVGDAGYWKDPLTAHGLTDALRDAELLARAIVAAMSGDASEHDALAGYQAARDRLSLPLFRTTDTISAQRWTDAEIGALLLQLSSTMADEVDAVAELGNDPFVSESATGLRDSLTEAGHAAASGREASSARSQLGEVAMDHRHAHRALAGCRDDALDVVRPQVAGGEDSGNAGLEGEGRAAGERPRGAVEVVAGQHEAVVVALDRRREPIGPRLGPDQDEQS